MEGAVTARGDHRVGFAVRRCGLVRLPTSACRNRPGDEEDVLTYRTGGRGIGDAVGDSGPCGRKQVRFPWRLEEGEHQSNVPRSRAQDPRDFRLISMLWGPTEIVFILGLAQLSYLCPREISSCEGSPVSDCGKETTGSVCRQRLHPAELCSEPDV